MVGLLVSVLVSVCVGWGLILSVGCGCVRVFVYWFAALVLGCCGCLVLLDFGFLFALRLRIGGVAGGGWWNWLVCCFGVCVLLAVDSGVGACVVCVGFGIFCCFVVLLAG